jgi:hypothetical protein
MLTFVWLTAFVYQDNIRGYVPAGITGLSILIITSLVLLIYLGFVSRRFRVFSMADNKYYGNTGKYILGGILGVPVAVITCSFYTYIFLLLFGYTLQKDILISLFGSVFMVAFAVWVHIKYINKKQITSH